jgi:hypothetical protein
MKKIKNDKKEAVAPNWKESEFAKSIDGQMMLMVENAINNGSLIEAQALSWASIDQLLLPRLIGWIAKIHKLVLPNQVLKLNAQSMNLIYLTLSHDVKLFEKLEGARRKRNEIMHKLTTLGDASSIKKKAEESVKENILLQQEIMKRFSGKTPIPSINLYRNGWNDALGHLTETIKSLP